MPERNIDNTEVRASLGFRPTLLTPVMERNALESSDVEDFLSVRLSTSDEGGEGEAEHWLS
ncbi:hypothetical protein KKP04_03855 [Rhodomicrobium sp. Az07]|uniref:hypothetical protein n=1 Tax=Rhodomicrobium sp. Az07 TaxID=2839034 RepID=UPI001BE87D79|nr:hypothetical protein [Rhodomicrobium sp. Az07]MBT3070003.1 hypothetical protein [Rhodomicrobium sp. Az07]